MKKAIFLTILWLILEVFLHLAAGVWAITHPVWMKLRYKATITVPVFENGVVVGGEPEVSADQKNGRYYLSRLCKLFYQGFTLQSMNAPYYKLKSSRGELRVYGPSPFIPYVRTGGITRTTALPENEVKVTRRTDENGYIIYEADRSKPSRTILILGGSTSDSPYPYYLWRELNRSGSHAFRVVVGALGAYTTADNVATLAFKGVDYKPDLIVFYESHNDLFPAYGPSFHSDYSHWRKTFDNPLMTQGLWLDRLPHILDASFFYSLLRRIALARPIQAFDYGIWGATAHYVPDLHDENKFKDTSVYARNLTTMAGIAKAHGSRFLLVTQLHQPRWMTPASYRYAEEMNAVVRQVAARRRPEGTYLYDFVKEFEPQRDKLMVRDGVHFDEPGYKILGESIARFIQNNIF